MLLVKAPEITFRIDLSQLQNKTEIFLILRIKRINPQKHCQNNRVDGKILRAAL